MVSKIQNSKIYKLLRDNNSEFLSTIDFIIPKVTQRLSVQVPKLFPEYTLHNLDHSVRVAGYIEEIVSDIRLFNDLELALMLLSALLHDLGMALGETEIELIRKDQFLSDQSIKYSSYVKVYGDKAEQEIVRRYHADISKKIIEGNEYSSRFILTEPHGVSYLEDICLLCESHTKDHLWMSSSLSMHNVKGKYSYNLRFLSHLLRIADLLDIDQSRTPFELYKLINPTGISDQEWKQHFIVTNTKKIECNPRSDNKNVVFYGKSEDIKTHRKLMSYINWINLELKVFKELYEKMDDSRFDCKLSNRTITKIETKGFTVSDYLLSLDFKSITELLMGENIYGDRKLGLREIIQNSIDACLVRKEIESQNSDYNPAIRIIIDSKKNTFVISDNGIGMSEEIIKNFFLNIGKSYYKSDIFKLSAYTYKPIGSFGIGFLACFMLSEDVKLETRYYKMPEKHFIQLEKGDEYIGFNSVKDVSFNGTTITLNLDQVLSVFDNEIKHIKQFINTFFVNDDYRLEIKTGEEIDIIQNTISNTKKPDKNETIIDISQYISDSKGYIKIKNKHEFIRDISDLKIDENSAFFVDANKLVKNVNFKDIVNIEENKLSYIALPLYEEHQRDEFEHTLSILDDDLDATIRKFNCDKTLHLFFPVEKQEFLSENEVFNEKNPQIHFELYLDDVINLKDYFCPKIDLVEINLLSNDSFSLLESFKSYNRYSNLWSGRKHKLYLRNIFIKNYDFTNQIMADTIKLVEFNINIYKNDIFPDISRNYLLPESLKSVNTSINIAVHLSAVDNFNFKEDEKRIILEFVKCKLMTENHFIRQKIIKKYGL